MDTLYKQTLELQKKTMKGAQGNIEDWNKNS